MVSHVWMIPKGPKWCRAHGIGPGVERFLAEQYGLFLGNSGNKLEDVWPPGSAVIPEGHAIIARMFSYEPNRSIWLTEYSNTVQFMYEQGIKAGVFLYDCGDGDYLGTDEPWTRGGINLHQKMLNWGRMIQRVSDAIIDYPGLMPVITHPRAGFENHFEDAPKVCDLFGNKVVYAFDAHIIEMAVQDQLNTGASFRDTLDIPADAEVWCYCALYERCGICISRYEPTGLCKNPDSECFGEKVDLDERCDVFVPMLTRDPYRAGWMSQWTPTPLDCPWQMNAWAEERGISAVLHNTSLKYLVDEAATDPRQMLKPNGVQWLTGKEGG